MAFLYFKYTFGLAFLLKIIREGKKNQHFSFLIEPEGVGFALERLSERNFAPPLSWRKCTKSRATILLKKLGIN